MSKTGLTSNMDQPPPLKGEDIKNTLIWVLAFTPIIGFLLQYIMAEFAQISINNLWFIPITMNTIICMIDVAYLKRQGYTEKGLLFWGLTLIPVYLYKRAKLVKQQPYYLVVWIMMFIGTMFLAVVLSLLGSNVNDQRVHMVKNGAFEGYGDRTLGEMIEGQNSKVDIEVNDGNHFIEADQGELLLERAGKEYIILDGVSINEGESQEMTVDIDGDGEEEYFIIRRASQMGWEVMGASGGFMQDLISELYTDDAFDDEGEIRDDYYAQVTCHDLDGDGIQEVLVSVGNKLTEMETLVYHISDLNPQAPFELAGNITGQEKMYIENGHTIIAPYGSQGLFTEYQYIDGLIIK